MHPQFFSIGSVVGFEIEGVANGCEFVGITSVTSAVDDFQFQSFEFVYLDF